MRLILALFGALLPLVCSTVWASAEAQPQQQDDPIRVLIVTGVDWKGHLWKETGPALRNVLEQDGRFDVRIVEAPAFLASDGISDFDVIFLHFKNYEPIAHEAEAKQNLLKTVQAGTGLVVLHFASGAFPGWPDYRNLAGMVWDQKNSHDPLGPFTVKIANHEHPITKGMQDFQTHDELYICLEGDRPVQLLAAARSVKTGGDHPMAFAFTCGKGRLFHTPLGHDVRAITSPGTAELIRRGTASAAGRQVP